MRDDAGFMIMLICIIIIIPLAILFIKLIINSGLPLWLKVILLK